MKDKTENLLPKTAEEIDNGGVYRQRVRCGKLNCRCARGEFHTAFYFFTRRDGKLVKQYIRQRDVKRMKKLATQAAGERAARRQTDQSTLRLLKYLRSNLTINGGTLQQLREQMEKDDNEKA